MEAAIVFVSISVEKAGTKEAEVVFFHEDYMANIFSIYKSFFISFQRNTERALRHESL